MRKIITLSLVAAALAVSAHQAGEARRDGLLFLAGVLSSFLVLAGALLILRAGGEAIGWGFQLQSPAVIAGLALLMLIFLFSLASIPPTAGFFAKFYILVALVEQGYVGLAVIAVLLSAVAAFFYIRIVMLMYMKEEAQPFDLALTPSLR